MCDVYMMVYDDWCWGTWKLVVVVVMWIVSVEVICDVCVGDGEVWMCVDMERGV